MILKIAIPGKMKLKITRREPFPIHRKGDLHYIGGAEVLPPPLQSDQENQVIGDLGTEYEDEAKAILIEHNLRLVVYIAKKFDNTGVGVEDLISIGTIGLIKAIDNFNLDLDVKFYTYGVPMIIGELRRYLRDNSALRISRSMRDTAYKILRAREALLVETQREPTVEQLARYLDIPREDVVFAMDAFSDPVSLYEPLYADSGDTVCVMDQVRDEKNTDESWLDRIALKDAIARLDPRQRSILALRFCQGKTQMEVSSEIGISQAQVSRLEKTALSSIRKNM